MDIEITRYNDSMRPQVIKLFVDQYKIDTQSFEELFQNFYFHTFQKDKCLLVVALDGKTVAGFQSVFYWPYSYKGKLYNSFQSGNSIVHPGYRGKGIFNRMLEFIDIENKTAGIDFLMGFPVNESLKNFLKDKWNHVFNLKWYVKPCNVFGFFSGRITSSKNISEGCSYFENSFLPGNTIGMLNDKSFTEWRESYQVAGTYYSYKYKRDANEVIIHLKKNKRKKIINELIIGSVLFNSEEAVKLTGRALEGLMQEIRKTYAIHFLSISVNEESSFDLKSELQKLAFNRTGKSINFVVKSFTENNFLLEPTNWFLSRSDVDTW